jgi:photosystem II stability/assembly factor-like uncharacterized protein
LTDIAKSSVKKDKGNRKSYKDEYDPLVREQAGVISGELGRKIVASTDGGETIEKERKVLEGRMFNFLHLACSAVDFFFPSKARYNPEG